MPAAPHQPDELCNAAVRIDKWLWAARFYKTRGLASAAIHAGHIRINGKRCKPAREIRIGDVLHIIRGAVELEVRVEKLSAVRGPAPVAQTLYAETAESREKRASEAEMRRLAPNAAPLGERPTKRDRRRIDRLHKPD